MLAALTNELDVAAARRKISERQMKLWMVHLRKEFNRPDRSDYYVAALRWTVIAALSKGDPPPLEKMILSFKDETVSKQAEPRGMSTLEYNKRLWMGRLAGMNNVTVKTASDNEAT